MYKKIPALKKENIFLGLASESRDDVKKLMTASNVDGVYALIAEGELQ